MKKYKLIKLYPGSPLVGTIASDSNGSIEFTELDLNKYTTSSSTGNIFKRQIESHPEFWEEIIEVEKDYKILSYIKKGSKTCTTTKRRGGESHEEFWNIHSVERLSDGEVFTVGDKVKVYEHGSIKTITEIAISSAKSSVKEGIWLRYDAGSSHLINAIKVVQTEYEILKTCPIEGTIYSVKRLSDNEIFTIGDKTKDGAISEIHIAKAFAGGMVFKIGEKQGVSLNTIEKLQPVFTTDDEVDIYIGDTYYYVGCDVGCDVRSMAATKFSGRTPKLKYFSTFEKAQDYFITNVKALSIKEFWEITTMSGSDRVKSIVLEQLVRKRLNLK